MYHRIALRYGLISLLAASAVACAVSPAPTPTATATPRVHTQPATVTAAPSRVPTTTASPIPATSTRRATLTHPTVTVAAAATTGLTGSPTPAPTTVAPATPEPVTPTGSPTLTVAPTGTPQPDQPLARPAGLLRAYETTLTLQTYGYEAAFQSTTPDDPIYPYPRMDAARVGPPAPRSYQALVLENDYVIVTVLPQLGGRIYRWIDKATGRHLLYENPVVKPTQWGYRGWWLAAGGIEWAFPVEEHGLNEWRPWAYTVAQTARGIVITVSDTEDRTGVTVGVAISLDAEHSYLTIAPWAKNATGTPQSYQLWLNAMITLGDNRVGARTRVILPTDQVIVHSTGDGALPGPWQPLAWPIYGGRDLSRYGTWSNYLGFFVPHVSEGFVALYDEDADQGIVRTFNPGWPAGTKIFGPATLPPSLWTDDGSSYIELWSGATATFADYATLQPGASVGWTERWYPAQGIGSVRSANAVAVLSLSEVGGTVEVGTAVTAPTTGELTLYVGGAASTSWSLALLPGQAFRSFWNRPAGTEEPLGLRLRSTAGEYLIQTGAVP
ncbi:MAG: DUF5107 domain-containing protein [Anaerolineae bacterium]|nr:DUF5107 domain-containing protein [Anaerolineae bacterium]